MLVNRFISKYQNITNDIHKKYIKLQDSISNEAFSIKNSEHTSYNIYNPKGDGYCFWRALSKCKTGDEENYKYFMKKCITSKKPDETISNIFVEFWEIPIISKYLKTKINILHAQDDKEYIFICNPDSSTDSIEIDLKTHRFYSQDINIKYIPGHYQAIIA